MVEHVGWLIGSLIALAFVTVIVFIGYFRVFGEADLFLMQQAPQALVLEAAVECSYYRCAQGCESPQTVDSSIFPCRTDFCNATWTDTGKPDGKICDANAKPHASLFEPQCLVLDHNVPRLRNLHLRELHGNGFWTSPKYLRLFIRQSASNCFLRH